MCRQLETNYIDLFLFVVSVFLLYAGGKCRTNLRTDLAVSMCYPESSRCPFILTISVIVAGEFSVLDIRMAAICSVVVLSNDFVTSFLCK